VASWEQNAKFQRSAAVLYACGSCN